MSSPRPDGVNWRKQALCAGHPDRGAWFSEDTAVTKRAQAVCRACPVREDCLAFAVGTGQRDGIWGGMTPYQRRRLRKAKSSSLEVVG
ncbi:MAG TPA: WhiB family transcriptional regulator [Acidimicrobiales bacterium]|nr:WhiB family transcriptional regulator [Acidimicrobiales bacterium]